MTGATSWSNVFLVLLLGGCGRRQTSLGDYEKVTGLALEACSAQNAAQRNAADMEGVFRCELSEVAYGDPSHTQPKLACPCDGTMSIERESANDISRIELTLTHCSRATAVARIEFLLAKYIDDRSRVDFARDLENPTGDAKEAKYITVKQVYGNVTAETIWSADTYRDSPRPKHPDATQAVGLDQLSAPTETYVVALTPRGANDHQQRDVSNDPRVTERPRCK